MAEFIVGFSQSLIDPDERARRLSRVYAYILSLPDPPSKDAEPAENFGEDAAGSAREAPAHEASAD